MASSYGAPRQTGWGNDRQSAPTFTISTHDIVLASPIPDNLFSDVAKEKAARVYESGEGRKNNATQLRKFYDELVMWFDKVYIERTKEARAIKYTELAPFIKMMNAKVAYARGREHVDTCFEQLFSRLIQQISDAETLKHAKLFMEAFMGFYKAQEK